MSYQLRRPQRHQALQVRGLKHHLTWWGEPSETPVVLLHGYMDAGATWQFLVDHLPESWSCVAPDWRGFGGTEWAAGGYWFPDYFADLDALLDVLVPGGRACVIGHSMGANVAMMYAGIRPQRLAWLANLEGFGLPPLSPSLAPPRYEQWLDQLRAPPRESRYGSVAQLASIIRQRNSRIPRDKAEFIARAWSRATEQGISLAADPRHRLVNPVLYRRDEVEACWRRMEIPMLFLMGELSEFRRLPGSGEEAMRMAFPGASFAVVPNTGHALHHEDPETVARYIIEFAGKFSSVR